MKPLSLFLWTICYFGSTLCHAQKSPPQIVTGYLGNVIVAQGAKVGVSLSLKDWSKEQTRNDRTLTKDHTLFTAPQVGFFSRPLFYSGFLINNDLGIRKQKAGKKMYHAVALGLGYLAWSEVLSFTVDFKGEVIARERTNWGYFMPSLSYELGREVVDNIGWFVKINYGLRLSTNESLEQSGLPLVEIGTKFPLKTKAQ